MSDEVSDFHQVTLGTTPYTIVAQGIGRIRRKLVKLISLMDGEGGALDSDLDEELHSLLKTFIPELPPLYSLYGYTSQEAYEAGEEPDEAAATNLEPTLPQLLDTIDTIYRVNGADRLVRLGKAIVGPDLLRTLVRKELTQFSLSRSPSSPLPSGDSPSTSSTTTDPTLEPSEDSLSPDSSPSSQPETGAAATS